MDQILQLLQQIIQNQNMIMQALNIGSDNFEQMQPEMQDMKLKQEFKKQTKATDEDMGEME